MNPNFFEGAPDPQADPMGYYQQQRQASFLTKQGMAPQQGQMVSGQYVAPEPVSYANQLASALMGGYKNYQLRDAKDASETLNGGAPQQKPVAQIMNWNNGSAY